jgi:hypothetical protein
VYYRVPGVTNGRGVIRDRCRGVDARLHEAGVGSIRLLARAGMRALLMLALVAVILTSPARGNWRAWKDFDRNLAAGQAPSNDHMAMSYHGIEGTPGRRFNDWQWHASVGAVRVEPGVQVDWGYKWGHSLVRSSRRAGRE